jgi:hypothetical protein
MSATLYDRRPPSATHTTVDPNWLLAPPAARILGCNKQSLPGLVARGLIRRRQIPGTHPRYSREDCENLARRSTIGGSGPPRQ